jgi:hypothetical protein
MCGAGPPPLRRDVREKYSDFKELRANFRVPRSNFALSKLAGHPVVVPKSLIKGGFENGKIVNGGWEPGQSAQEGSLSSLFRPSGDTSISANLSARIE